MSMFSCAYFGKKIKDNQPLSAIDIKFVKGTDFSDREGEFIQVYLNALQREVPMIVTTSDSESQETWTGWPVTVCSQQCGSKLKTALEQDINFSR
ncbi:hypothetical protein WMZ97_08115 [Lentibacillus sp. N15]|uniref:hypothetical protein n=1 Tax=Lentibacillus songyuanensis TaxID=3136161 RepID=UPI0031B9E2B2